MPQIYFQSPTMSLMTHLAYSPQATSNADCPWARCPLALPWVQPDDAEELMLLLGNEMAGHC